jgi:hypothetical protein
MSGKRVLEKCNPFSAKILYLSPSAELLRHEGFARPTVSTPLRPWSQPSPGSVAFVGSNIVGPFLGYLGRNLAVTDNEPLVRSGTKVGIAFVKYLVIPR